jgi:hypothetical protein
VAKFRFVTLPGRFSLKSSGQLHNKHGAGENCLGIFLYCLLGEVPPVDYRRTPWHPVLGTMLAWILVDRSRKLSGDILLFTIAGFGMGYSRTPKTSMTEL